MSDPTAGATRGRMHQGLIDAEMRASRRAILAGFRDRLRTDATTLAAPDFLTLADETTVHAAIIIAAQSIARADACDLQIYDAATQSLRIVRHRGLPLSFVDHFAAVDASVASACAAALETGDPVLIDDIVTSPIFAGQPTLEVMLSAGSRAVHSYPLRDDSGRLLGMLSLHYRAPGRRPPHEHLAWNAARALAPVADLRRQRTATPDGAPEPEPMTAEIGVTSVDGMTVVAVKGPLDAVTVPDFTDVVRRTLTDLAAPHIVIVDLRESDFLAAAGARALFETDEQCRARTIGCYLIAGADHDARAVLGRLDTRADLRIVQDIGEISGVPADWLS